MMAAKFSNRELFLAAAVPAGISTLAMLVLRAVAPSTGSNAPTDGPAPH
jgi:hypothetical protein